MDTDLGRWNKEYRTHVFGNIGGVKVVSYVQHSGYYFCPFQGWKHPSNKYEFGPYDELEDAIQGLMTFQNKLGDFLDKLGNHGGTPIGL